MAKSLPGVRVRVGVSVSVNVTVVFGKISLGMIVSQCFLIIRLTLIAGRP